MTEVKIETVEKQTGAILQKVGKESYVNWESFSQNSTDVVKSIDELNEALAIFRESQHKNFIQTMKKLKSLDLPDLLQAVEGKKLPKEALRGVLTRFKLEGQNLDLIESPETLKATAEKQFADYVEKNKEITAELKKFTAFINEKISASGFTIEKAKQITEPKATVKFDLSQELASKIAGDIEIEYLPQSNQLIGLKTYNQIVDGTFKLIKDEYRKITIDARIKQRKNMNNHPEYLKAMNQYLENCEALISQSQALISEKVGISEQKLGQSEIAMMERGMSNNLLMAQSQLRGKIKESIKSDKDVSIEVAKEVVKYQVKLIDEKSSEINSILSGLQKGPESIQMIPMLLALILNDYVFEKYGYEEEDFMKNLGEDVISTNPDFMEIFKDMEMGIMRLMQKLDVVPPEVAQMMQQQQAFMQSQQAYMQQMGGMNPMMPGMMPPGMMPPGIGQSTNPMQMLQMQQIQQMQQMFSQMQPPK